MRFYHKDECPFCWKARIALAEAKIDYKLITLGPDDDRGELKRLSPSGTLPVLVHGDTVIWDSSVIVEYANDVCSNTLLHGSWAERARMRLLHSYSDGLGKYLRDVIFEKRAKPGHEWDLERIARGEEGWRASLDWLEAHLRGQDYFVGQFSIAECALFPRFALAERYGVGVDGRHPGLLRWYLNTQKRVSCQTTRPVSWAT